MSEQNYNEKDEKDLRKREEKSAEEKQWDEKVRRDPLSALVWAGIFIWAGLVLLADNLGWLDSLLANFAQEPADFLDGFSAWSAIFLGAGVILLIEAAIRMLIPEYRKPVTGTIIFGFILIGIGAGSLFPWDVIWPLVLVGIGVSMLIRAITGRR